MSIDGQLALFDLDETKSGQSPEPWSPPEIDGECEHCGAPISSRNPMDSVNHGPMEGTCTSRALTRNHALYAYRKLDDALKNPEEEKWKLQLLKAEYEHEAHRATKAWNGDGWKDYTP